jgi:fatty-acyl-CoA synthase
VLGTPEGYRGAGVLQRFWEIVERHRINFFAGVPTLYSALLQVPIDGRRIDSLELGLCGAASMPVEVFRTFEERTGIKILEGYGLTEANCITSLYPPRGDRRVGSVGVRIPFQPTKTIVVDEHGRYVRDCTTDEVGLIVVSGPHVFAGYKVKEHNEGLWPDLGDGIHYFWLTGRKKELIIRGGHNIDPASIEAPFHKHPAVELAAAIGRPDAHAGELPVVYLQLRAGATATEDELLAFARTSIPERAAHPKRIRIIEKMPLTAVGKISKPVLKRLEIEDALKQALADAGVQVRVLEVREDKKLGMTIRVVAGSGDAERSARTVLGEYSFPVEFELQT